MSSAMLVDEEMEDRRELLPRNSPFVGSLRHAPQMLRGQLDRLLRRRAPASLPDEGIEEMDASPTSSKEEPELNPAENSRDGKLPSSSPYVGFQRHAPPSSPVLYFSVSPPPALAGLKELELSKECLPGELPEEVWVDVLQSVIEVDCLAALSRVSVAFHKVVESEDVWRDRAVRVPPSCLADLAPHLGRWLSAWGSAEKLVLPRSAQLLSEVASRAPDLPVEVSWRFDQHLKGLGVEVLKHGTAVRRVAEEELVVLGDAALQRSPGRWPYFEVQLDKCGEGIGDSVNDFGFGVTACDPQEIEELGSVADEVPRSWVVDFTQSMVCLSINNHEAAQGKRLSAAALKQGSCVGMLVKPMSIEIYIDGVLQESLPMEERVPDNISLFPVLDLYGRTIEISKTDAEEPRKCRKESALAA
ncbi:tauD [Symbiodinium microadriaticum]|nr:tauD [Symbiodinium microadriaticum]CAE7949409.1 tauD [Symbiodinium sp. KB8]